MTIVLLLLALLGPGAHATGPRMRAYLFIALDRVEGRPYYWLGGQTREEQLEAMFTRSSNALDLDLVVVRGATLDDLIATRALTEATTAAVYWVGHSGAATDGTGLAAEGVMADALGNDVAPLFQNVHPNVRWLAIVGCRASGIFDRYKLSGYYDRNPLLKIFAYDTPVEPSLGLSQATANGYLRLSYMQREYPRFQCDPRPRRVFRLYVERRSGAHDGTPLTLLVDGHVVGAFGSLAAGRVEGRWIESSNPRPNLEVVVGRARAAAAEVGELTITDPAGGVTHDVLRRANGEIMGRGRRVYVFRQDREALVGEDRTPACLDDSSPGR